MCICLRKVFKTSLWSNLPWTSSLLSSFLLKSGYISIYSFQVTSNLFHVELSNWFAFLTYPSYHSLHISFLVDVTFVHEKGSYFSTILNFNVALLHLSVIRYKSFNLLLWTTVGLIIQKVLANYLTLSIRTLSCIFSTLSWIFFTLFSTDFFWYKQKEFV